MNTTAKPRHIGRNISRIRELRGMKQEALAQALGISQQSVSTLENSEELDDKRLKDVAEALGVSVEGIKAFSDEAVINYFNNIHDNEHSHFHIAATNNNCTFNPLDKLMEIVDENRKLYERLVEAERERANVILNYSAYPKK